MSDWPPIAEPELLRRLALDEAGFMAFIRGVVERLPSRECDADALARALAYPWARPLGSYLLSGGELEAFEAMAGDRRRAVLGRFTGAGSGRLPVLAIGSNAAPAALERKLAHFDAAEDRTVLALTGRLHGFDVGVAAQPTMYGSLPATLFPSPGTAVGATILWVTPAQFTQLAWSEITYRLGRLRARFEVEETATGFDEVLVFVSRFGVFCPDGEPVALAAIPAAGRSAPELSEEQLLDRAAALALGPGSDAGALVRAIFERPAETAARVATTVHRAALPFSSPGWTPFPPSPGGHHAAGVEPAE
jgi:hypothetical protein